ncbi:pyridoxal-dependent decarboxylase, exosortase A system-associated [Pseudonocardia alni]|uniref:pyridoxal-dependent decarboxylase, exosortase A system-associated n=1 Tax=Pseudonocardia alni TaxID=33907 RepID=UPI00279BE5AA|nr:pyridoxal-dependent decarboxylase, exosortase A system-associated [Pseudonocardia alni]
MTAGARAVHPTVATFPVSDRSLIVGGLPVERLAERVGSTPFFAYDRSKITERVRLVRRLLPVGIELNYAVKANPMVAVVQHMSSLVDGLDVASANEMRRALDTTTPPGKVGFAGPGKSWAELTQAVAAGVTIEVESETEAQRVVQVGQTVGVRPHVAVRVNPDFAVKGSGMRLGGGPQQFGIDSEQVPELLRKMSSWDLDFVGFHIFAGSQNLHAEILCDAQRRTVDLALQIARDADVPLRHLNVGGGFGVPYFANDEPLDLARIGENLHLQQERVRAEFPGVRMVVELGRYLVGEAGVYVTRVLDRKRSRGRTFVVVDGGMHHQLAASGNLGQVIRRDYPIAIGNRMDSPDLEPCTVVGRLCTPLDLLAQNSELPPCDVGDLVVVFLAGAYGKTASPTDFLSHPEPVEVLI